MPVPNIDTFEHDIREEIKHREASVGDIASASGSLGNTPTQSQTGSGASRIPMIIGGLMLVFILAGFGYLGYVYMIEKPASKEKAAEIVEEQIKNENTEKIITDKLRNISPTFAVGVAHYTSRVDTSALGSVLTLDNYASVFAFMIKNEPDLAKEIMASEIGKYAFSTTTPDLSFMDVTRSNQNMRVLTVGSSTFVYAFFGEKYLAVAKSPEDILQIRGALIK